MVNNDRDSLNRVFSALSDPTRRAMLSRLAKQDMSVAELAEPFDLSKAAITKHVKVLENAGLLQRSIEGRVHFCSLKSGPLEQASEWISFYRKFWNENLDSLDAFLNSKDIDH